MKQALLIFFLLLGIVAQAQIPKYIPFATGNADDTAKTKHILLTGSVRLGNYPNTDTNKVITTDKDGRIIFVTKTAGGGGGGSDAQTLSAVKIGDSIAITISNGNTVYLNIKDRDSSATNEIQVLSKSGDTLFLSGGGYVVLSYVTSAALTTVLNDYYNKTQIDLLLNAKANKSQVDSIAAQANADFLNTPTDSLGQPGPRSVISFDGSGHMAWTVGDQNYVKATNLNIVGGFSNIYLRGPSNALVFAPVDTANAPATAAGATLGTFGANGRWNNGSNVVENTVSSISFLKYGPTTTRNGVIRFTNGLNSSNVVSMQVTGYGIFPRASVTGGAWLLSADSAITRGISIIKGGVADGRINSLIQMYLGQTADNIRVEDPNGNNIYSVDAAGITAPTALKYKGEVTMSANFSTKDSMNTINLNTATAGITITLDSANFKGKMILVQKKTNDLHTSQFTSLETINGSTSPLAFNDNGLYFVYHNKPGWTINHIPEPTVQAEVDVADYGAKGDKRYGSFNFKTGSDTVTTSTPTFTPAYIGARISIDSARSNAAYSARPHNLTAVIDTVVNDTMIVIDRVANYSRRGMPGYFGTSNWRAFIDAANYAATIGNAKLVVKKAGDYAMFPLLSDYADTLAIGLRNSVSLELATGVQLTLGVEDAHRTDTSTYKIRMFMIMNSGNYSVKNIRAITGRNISDDNVNFSAFLETNPAAHINGSLVIEDYYVNGDTVGTGWNSAHQWGNFVINGSRTDSGKKFVLVLRNGYASVNSSALNMFNDYPGKTVYGQNLQIYGGGSPRMTEPIYGVSISSGSRVLSVSGYPYFTFKKQTTQYSQYYHKYPVEVILPSGDTLSTQIDSIISPTSAYLHDASPETVSNDTAYGMGPEGEVWYVGQNNDSYLDNVTLTNFYKYGLHYYVTNDTGDAEHRYYNNYRDVHDSRMMWGQKGNGSIPGRHQHPVVEIRNSDMEMTPYNQPLHVLGYNSNFAMAENYVNAGSVFNNCTFYKHVGDSLAPMPVFVFGRPHTDSTQGDTTVFNNCVMGSLYTQPNCYAKMNGGMQFAVPNDDNNFLSNVVDAKGGVYSNRLKTTSLQYNVMMIDPVTGEHARINADSFTRALRLAFRKVGKDSVFGVTLKGDTTFLYRDTVGAGGGSGNTILNGSGAPSSGTGSNGDFYLNTTNYDIYGPKTGGAWGSPTSLIGPAGATGATGATGSAGSNGTNGNTVLSGTTAPGGGTGVNGDFYINTATSQIYGPKSGGVWGSPTSLVGATGSTGADGKTVLNGAGAPGGGTGTNGDFYINTSNWDLYLKSGGSWALQTNLVGPAGATGATGSTGATGAAGADGKSLLNGSGAPSGGTGNNGDFYINTAANTIYGPKTGGAWGLPTSIVGPTGATGSAGSNGTDGKTVLNGSGAPSGATGNNGDFYLNTANYDFYGPKSGGSWGSPVSLKYNITPQTLTSGTSITYDIANGVNAYLALAHNGTISMSKTGGSVVAGETGVLTVRMTSPGSFTLAVPNGTVTLNSNTGDTTTIAWYYNGTNFVWRDGNATAINTSTGTLLNIQYLTSGTTYTPTTGTSTIILYMVGGGGGGGGTTGGSSQLGAGGGGGAGALLIKKLTGISGTYTYAIGSAGSAGTTGPGAGGAGGNTTFTAGATTYTAGGGSGGTQQATGTTAAMIAGGAGGTATNGDVNGGGAPGERGYRVSGTVGYSGNGGSSFFGGGGSGQTASAVGGTATGYGAGGGGGLSTSTTNRAGGAGTAGIIIVYEFK